MPTVIRIDKEFSQLIAPLQPDEYRLLRESILEHGCFDALRLWDDFLIDGHHRYEICTKHCIPFFTVSMDFESRDDAKIWIFNNQLGRRNITDEYRTYIIGARYELEMTSGHGSKTGHQNNTQNGSGRIRDVLADELDIGSATVTRAAQYKRAVDEIAKHSDELKDSILAGDMPISKQETVQFGAVLQQKPKVGERALDEIIGGTARNFRHALALAGYTNENASRVVTINVSNPERVAKSLRRHMKPEEIDRLIELLEEK